MLRMTMIILTIIVKNDIDYTEIYVWNSNNNTGMMLKITIKMLKIMLKITILLLMILVKITVLMLKMMLKIAITKKMIMLRKTLVLQ